MPTSIVDAQQHSFAGSVGNPLIRCGATSGGEPRATRRRSSKATSPRSRPATSCWPRSRLRDEGTAMEAWYAHTLGKPVIVYTGGTPPHPWTVYVAESVHVELEQAIQALAGEGRADA